MYARIVCLWGCAFDGVVGVCAQQINICPGKIDPTSTSTLAQQRATVLHELMHVLAFEPDLWATYTDANGNTLNSTEIYLNEIMFNPDPALGKSVTKIVLPLTLNAAR
jgi:hypothetical protein